MSLVLQVELVLILLIDWCLNMPKKRKSKANPRFIFMHFTAVELCETAGGTLSFVQWRSSLSFAYFRLIAEDDDVHDA